MTGIGLLTVRLLEEDSYAFPWILMGFPCSYGFRSPLTAGRGSRLGQSYLAVMCMLGISAGGGF